MSKARVGLTVVVSLLSLPSGVFAQAPANPITQTLRGAWSEAKTNIRKSADVMPEAKYGFKPVETVRSFGAELVELPESPRLRPLVAKPRAQVEETREVAAAPHVVLDERARDRRRPLGPQRQAASLAIGERVHLLLHDVGRLADGAREERRVLEERSANLLVAEALHDGADDRLEPLPHARVLGKDVVRPLRRLESHSAVTLPLRSGSSFDLPADRAATAPCTRHAPTASAARS